MGVSMALHEETVTDPRYGHYVNHDLAEYHVATNADIGELDISWLDHPDELANELGLKGIGEIGITGAAAAVANAYWHATGLRIRDLPITPDKYFRSEGLRAESPRAGLSAEVEHGLSVRKVLRRGRGGGGGSRRCRACSRPAAG